MLEEIKKIRDARPFGQLKVAAPLISIAEDCNQIYVII